MNAGMKGGGDESVNRKELLDRVNQYTWYHRINLADGVFTTPRKAWDFQGSWDLILDEMRKIDFHGKRVLDIGCRDGLFSFEAERRGARDVIGIDNSISDGALELLIPLFKSKVKMYELNLYDLRLERFGLFDVILFFGVLYHLRYPFWAIKKLSDCLSDGGLLLVESGMLIDESLEDEDYLYCPVEKSPYEKTSCSFFNETALATTLRSFNFKLLYSHAHFLSERNSVRKWLFETRTWLSATIRRKRRPVRVGRKFLAFQKDMSLGRDEFLESFWHGTWEHECFKNQ